jgi:hypothetical protein
MPVWNRRSATLAARATAAQARHLGRGSGFIDEDQVFRVEVRLSVEPRLTPRGDVWPILLAGMRGFF